MKKVLILYASYGGGHLSAAKSVQSYMDENYEDIETNLVDCIKYINKPAEKVSTKIYMSIATKHTKIWEKLYKTSNKGAVSGFSTGINNLMAKKLFKLIKAYNPDLIVSTHPFSTQMCARLREKEKISCPLVTILTDFVLHNQWLTHKEYNNLFCVSTDNLRQKLIEAGVDENKVITTGIPISQRFKEHFDREEICKMFNLDPNKKVMLFFGGGELGIGRKNTLDILEAFAKGNYDVQVVTVAGRNEKLKASFEEIAAKYNKEDLIKVLGYTTQVPELMSISTLVITKPGGLTSSESLACKLPLLLINPIPGQEVGNAELLEEIGAAIWIKPETNLDELFNKVFNNEETLAKMKENSTKLARLDSTKTICDICIKEVL